MIRRHVGLRFRLRGRSREQHRGALIRLRLGHTRVCLSGPSHSTVGSAIIRRLCALRVAARSSSFRDRPADTCCWSSTRPVRRARGPRARAVRGTRTNPNSTCRDRGRGHRWRHGFGARGRTRALRDVGGPPRRSRSVGRRPANRRRPWAAERNRLADRFAARHDRTALSTRSQEFTSCLARSSPTERPRAERAQRQEQ